MKAGRDILQKRRLSRLAGSGIVRENHPEQRDRIIAADERFR